MNKVFYSMLMLLLTSSLFAQNTTVKNGISYTTPGLIKSKESTDLNKMVSTGCTDYVFYQDIALNSLSLNGNGISETPFSGINKGYDDFTFSSTETISTVIITIVDFVNGCSSPEFSITFHADNAGTPGAVLASREVLADAAIYTKEEIITPWNGASTQVYKLHIPITPVTLNAGIYWLGIYSPNQSDSFDGVFWQQVNDPNHAGASAFIQTPSGSFPLNTDFAFAFCSGESTPVSYCEPTVEVEAICQNTTITLGANGQASITASDVDGGSVGAVTSSVSPATFNCSHIGPNTVTLTVNDDAGNSSTCMATVTVQDNTAPVIANCQGNTALFNGQAAILSSSVIDFSATDACGIANTTYSPEMIPCGLLGQTVPVTVSVTDNNGQSNSCIAHVATDGLPCGYMDFGDDGISCEDGNNVAYDVNSESFTLTSDGCYSTNFSQDNAAYVQSELCGDGEIIAHVTNINPLGQGWAGITMRESQAPGAKKVELLVNLSNFMRRAVRTTTNGVAYPAQFFRPQATWLKIIRTGNQFMGYASTNGSTWQVVMTANVPMNACIQAGLVVTNYNAGNAIATFDNVEVNEYDNFGLQIPDTGNPEKGITQDQDFSIFPNPVKEKVHLDLGNYYGQEAKVEMLNQLGQPVLQRQLNEIGTSPQTFDLNGLSSGTYFIRVTTDKGDKVKRFLIVK